MIADGRRLWRGVSAEAVFVGAICAKLGLAFLCPTRHPAVSPSSPTPRVMLRVVPPALAPAAVTAVSRHPDDHARSSGEAERVRCIRVEASHVGRRFTAPRLAAPRLAAPRLAAPRLTRRRLAAPSAPEQFGIRDRALEG